jgi:hypothetical protein
MPEETDSRDSTREPTPAHGAATASERAATTGSGVTGVIRGTGMPQPPASNTGRKPRGSAPAAPLSHAPPPRHAAARAMQQAFGAQQLPAPRPPATFAGTGI